MSIRKLASVVASLVLCTGLAVGLYVDALHRDPVRAAEPGAAPAPARAGELGGCSDDVRTVRSSRTSSRDSRGARSASRDPSASPFEERCTLREQPACGERVPPLRRASTAGAWPSREDRTRSACSATL